MRARGWGVIKVVGGGMQRGGEVMRMRMGIGREGDGRSTFAWILRLDTIR